MQSGYPDLAYLLKGRQGQPLYLVTHQHRAFATMRRENMHPHRVRSVDRAVEAAHPSLVTAESQTS